MAPGTAPVAAPLMDDGQFRVWKTQLVPLIYDWFSNHNLCWPTQACRWGPKIESHTYKDRHRVYLSEQVTTADKKNGPKLVVVDAEICKPRVASTEVVASWTDFSKCPYIRDIKYIMHPGEVNKIRELPQHPEVLVTHTDAPELYVWNVDKQPGATPKGDKEKKWPGPATAEAVLDGHQTPKGEPLFALATSNAAPCVASGGPDKLVLIWDLQDVQSGILTGARGGDNGSTTHVKARTTLKGHKATVEDVVFASGSGELLVSVGDDKQVLFWDTRAGAAPVMRVEAAHGPTHDVHCVDWNRLDPHMLATAGGVRCVDWNRLDPHMLATGADDGSMRVWDRRKLSASGANKSAAVRSFRQHTDSIMRIEWHPSERSVLASGGDDHLVLVWDLNRSSLRDEGAAAKSGSESGAAKSEGAGGSKSGGAGAKGAPPPELLFKHVGHREGKVVDFQWCPSDPWTMLSVSDDTHLDAAPAAGGAKGQKPKDGAAAADGAADGGGAAAAAAAAGAVLAPGVDAGPRGGGTLQIWRVNDLIYRPEDEVVEEMEQHREWILEGTNEPPRPKLPPAAPTPQAASGATGGGGGGGAGGEGEEEAEGLAASGSPGSGDGGGGGGEAASGEGGGAEEGGSGGGAAPMDVDGGGAEGSGGEGSGSR
ncbi:MAG: WD40-repeat-containing domain protein [Monoraphidium minutum]|nr:MAG: WD40-repeat-containing domain protein [Monoraphidium minutum]